MTRVLVVDDHPIFRAGAASTIGTEPDIEVIADVSSAAEALEAARRLKPDVILTDIRLNGDVNGVGLARSLREENSDVRIVVLTNYSNEPYVRAMMELGIEGYILKDMPPREVIESVRMVIGRANGILNPGGEDARKGLSRPTGRSRGQPVEPDHRKGGGSTAVVGGRTLKRSDRRSPPTYPWAPFSSISRASTASSVSEVGRRRSRKRPAADLS